MPRRDSLVIAKQPQTEHTGSAKTVEIGQWYWYTDEDGRQLVCVNTMGSNYVGVKTPGGATDRVLFEDVHKTMEREYDPAAVIQKKIANWQQEANRHLLEIKQITQRLGIVPTEIAAPETGGDNALVVMSEAPDIGKYKKALVKAKEKTLPELFEKVKKANKRLAMWMAAETLPLQAQAQGLNKHIDNINQRIFNVSLYAGLTENIKPCRDGEPARYADKLHVMQRKLYMDEECLFNYSTGGMEFSDIKEFDKWIAKDENMTRILPFPRTIVAMQVRRKTKEREFDGSLIEALINIRLENWDKLTFLYIRNGDKLYRMNCELDFDEFIFPDKSIFDPGEAMMMEMFGSHFHNAMITRSEWEARQAKRKEEEAKADAWDRDNPKENWFWNPHRRHYFYDYRPFDSSNPYYDEGAEWIKKQIDYYNRVALIIQGLFDRSVVLHPHPPVKTWESAGFDAAVKLIYDGSGVIAHGEPPNFELYRQKLNASLGPDSIVTGQELVWMQREARRENERSRNNWRETHKSNYKIYRPHGDPGPGVVSTITQWRKKSRKAVFKWTRERNQYRRYMDENRNRIPCSIGVAANALLNVSAYKPGDYKQFFNDPRTREHYLQWAPFLLAAEEYHAGNIILNRGGDHEWRRKKRRRTT